MSGIAQNITLTENTHTERDRNRQLSAGGLPVIQCETSFSWWSDVPLDISKRFIDVRILGRFRRNAVNFILFSELEEYNPQIPEGNLTSTNSFYRHLLVVLLI